MPANTAKGYPYPLGTDRLMDGDDAIKNLATAVDTKLGLVASGQVSINVTTAGSPASVAVTFPVGLFTAAPNVVACALGTNPNNVFAIPAQGPTATGCAIWGVRASVGAQAAMWIASQTP